ncbi:GNAT family N-acetyltransferase [Gordonia sinesedis]
MAGMSGTVVQPATGRAVVADVLTRAFTDDPVINWLQPDRTRHRRIFDALLRGGHGRPGHADIALRDGDITGAAVWDPPGFRSSPLETVVMLAGFVHALGTRIGRGKRVEDIFADYRPTEPHTYLAYLGAPTRGTSAGTALLHARLDELTTPAYLESSSEANLPLYERFGFQVTAEVTLPDGGPRVWPMYRPGEHG